MSKFTIIIPVFNTKPWIQHCLEHIEKYTPRDEYKLIVVDNRSSKSTKQLLSKFDIDMMISNDDNMGSAYAWNQGIQESDTEFVCIMHSDTLVSPGWYEPLIEALDEEDIVCSIPCTNYADEAFVRYDELLLNRYVSIKPGNKNVMEYADLAELLETFYEGDFEGFVKRNAKQRKGNFRRLSELSTFCCMFRKDLFDTYGLFDADFYPHMYFDKLFFLKFQADGLEAVCRLDSYVHHNGNSTSDGPGFNLAMNLEKLSKLLEEKKLELSDDNKLISSSEKDKILNPSRSLPSNILLNNNVKKILCIRYEDTGDVLQTLFLLSSLKKERPSIQIDYMTSLENVELIKLFPGLIDNTLIFPVKITEKIIYDNIMSHNYQKYKDDYDFIIDWTLYPENHEMKDKIPRIDLFNQYLSVESMKPNYQMTWDQNDSMIINCRSFIQSSKKNILILPDGLVPHQSLPSSLINNICKRFDPTKYNIIYYSSIEPSAIEVESVKSIIRPISPALMLHLINSVDLVICTDTYPIHMCYFTETPFLTTLVRYSPEQIISHLLDYHGKFEVIFNKEITSRNRVEEFLLKPDDYMKKIEKLLSVTFKDNTKEEELF